jgi:hypothetical protein
MRFGNMHIEIIPFPSILYKTPAVKGRPAVCGEESGCGSRPKRDKTKIISTSLCMPGLFAYGTVATHEVMWPGSERRKTVGMCSCIPACGDNRLNALTECDQYEIQLESDRRHKFSLISLITIICHPRCVIKPNL